MRDFFLCHNPLRRMPAGRVAYIYHPDSPRIFASVIEIDYTRRLTDSNLKGYNVLFGYFRGDGKRRIFVLMCMQGGDRNIDKTIALLQDAAGWYCTCLNKEDEATYGKGSWMLMQPFNTKDAPGLTALRLKAVDQYVISTQGSLLCTDGEKEFYQLIDLLYKKEDGREVEEGDINYA